MSSVTFNHITLDRSKIGKLRVGNEDACLMLRNSTLARTINPKLLPFRRKVPKFNLSPLKPGVPASSEREEEPQRQAQKSAQKSPQRQVVRSSGSFHFIKPQDCSELDTKLQLAKQIVHDAKHSFVKGSTPNTTTGAGSRSYNLFAPRPISELSPVTPKEPPSFVDVEDLLSPEYEVPSKLNQNQVNSENYIVTPPKLLIPDAKEPGDFSKILENGLDSLIPGGKMDSMQNFSLSKMLNKPCARRNSFIIPSGQHYTYNSKPSAGQPKGILQTTRTHHRTNTELVSPTAALKQRNASLTPLKSVQFSKHVLIFRYQNQNKPKE